MNTSNRDTTCDVILYGNLLFLLIYSIQSPEGVWKMWKHAILDPDIRDISVVERTSPRAGWIEPLAWKIHLSLFSRILTNTGAHQSPAELCSGLSSPVGNEAWACSWPLTTIWCWGQEWMELHLCSPHAFTSYTWKTLSLLFPELFLFWKFSHWLDKTT